MNGDTNSQEMTNHQVDYTFLQIWRFFVLSFVFTWLFWLAPLLSTWGTIDLPDSLVGPLMIIGTFGPTISALYLNNTRPSPETNKELLHRAIEVKFSWKWYLVIFLFLPLGGLLGNLINSVVNDVDFPVTDALKMPYMIPFIIIFSLFLGPISEEFGWRGYALDRMQSKMHPFWASVILGSIWALWHLPAFYIDGAPQKTIPPLMFAITTVSISVVITWVQNNTHRSLFPAIMLHAMINSTGEIFPLFNTENGKDWEPWLFANIYLVISAILIGIFKMKSSSTSFDSTHNIK